MQKTDLDLPLAYRTQANLWKMKFLEMREEVAKANKGIRRLNRKIERLVTQQDDTPDAKNSDDLDLERR